MTSYNRVNGTHADMNMYLRGVLRERWGWNGLAMSDWGGTNSAVESVEAGLDLEMPGPARRRGQNLLDAVRSGKLEERYVDDSVRRILRLAERTGKFVDSAPKEEKAIDRPEHRELLRQAAGEGIVLLKNDLDILPLSFESKKIFAVIGPNAKVATAGGGGSANLTPHYMTHPYSSLLEEAGNKVAVTYAEGCLTNKLTPTLDALTPELTVEFFASEEDMQKGLVAGTKTFSNSNIFLMSHEEVPAALIGTPYACRITATLTATETAPYIFGLSSIGATKLFLDEQLLIDNWNWAELSETFFNTASVEAKSSPTTLTANKTYSLRIDGLSSPPNPNMQLPVDNSLFTALNGIRIGALSLATTDDDRIALAVSNAKSADAAILVVGKTQEWESEGHDMTSLSLPGRQNDLIEAVAKVNPKTIVVVQSGTPIEMPWLDKVGAVLWTWYQGQENGGALVDVVTGKVNPSGKLPITFPKKLKDTASYGNFPFSSDREGKILQDEVRYEEGLLIGYKHHDETGVEPLFPFGFGLSYTKFEITNLDSRAMSDHVQITADLRNTRNVAGAEVVQAYIASPAGSGSGRPKKQFRGFAKVHLQPGESATATIKLDKWATAAYDAQKEKWVVVPGSYVAIVARSAGEKDEVGRVEFEITEGQQWL
ncbi:hypothetical protein YB2330_003002 [Saitoella coloradoensis]